MAVHAGRRGGAGGVDGEVGGQAFLEIAQAAVGHKAAHAPDFQPFHQDIADRCDIGPAASINDQNFIGGHALNGDTGRIVLAAQDLGRRQIFAHRHVA